MPTTFPTPTAPGSTAAALADLMELLQSLAASREVILYFKAHPDPDQLQITLKLPHLHPPQAITISASLALSLQSLITTNHADLLIRANKLIDETYGDDKP